MKTIKINPTQIKIIPTKKKFERAEKFAESTIGESGLPKEAPVEKKICIISNHHTFERIKEGIRVSIERMKGL